MWRAIKPEKRNGYLSQSIVEAIMRKQNENKALPTIFFYQWKPSSVAIGIFQKIKEACNQEECQKLGIDIVRRMSGGGSVYLDSENCFTYSIIAPEPNLSKNIRKSYEEVCGKVVEALRTFGVPAQFKPTNDIFIQDRKISGTVQTIKGNSIMVGGTMLMDLDLELMNRVLIYDRKKLESKGIKNSFKSVTCVKEHSQVSKDELIETLAGKFSNNNFSWGELTQEELELAKKLEKEKYSTQEWIFRR